MATPHNAAQTGDIAKTVLMPGDPLRAKYIADNYLTDVRCFNTVRNMLGFTGNYNGCEVSVMGSGMGMPAIGIYSYELFNFFEVDNIIRVGSAGGMQEGVHVRDLVIGMGASTNSNYGSQFGLPGSFSAIASYPLMAAAIESAKENGANYHVGNILSSDTFYSDDTEGSAKWRKLGVMAVEMEAAALYMNAARAGKNALAILTISDHLLTGEATTAEERQNSFTQMMEVALETAVKMSR